MVLANKINKMKNILLILLFSCINIFAQTGKFCTLYVSQCKNESMLEEVYNCDGKFFLKFKYGETKDAVLEKQKDGSYKITNIGYMINQKYLDIKKFQNEKYFIIIKKDRITLRVIKGTNEKKFYDYLKSKKIIPKYLLES